MAILVAAAFLSGKGAFDLATASGPPSPAETDGTAEYPHNPGSSGREDEAITGRNQISATGSAGERQITARPAADNVASQSESPVFRTASVSRGTRSLLTSNAADGPAIRKVAAFVTADELILILNDVTSHESPISSVKFRLLDRQDRELIGWQDFGLLPRGRRSYAAQMQRLSLVGLNRDEIAAVEVQANDEAGDGVVARSAVSADD
jgi:hypothetical protein